MVIEYPFRVIEGARLQKLQIRKMLMQDSIINTLFVVVAWCYEKINNMKETSHHHEILYFANTSLANKQLTGTGKSSRDKNLSAFEELEDACWNGILHEIFPEILGSLYPNCESFLQQVLTGKNFLYINIGASPVIADHDTSIDPYSFAMCICEN